LRGGVCRVGDGEAIRLAVGDRDRDSGGLALSAT